MASPSPSNETPSTETLSIETLSTETSPTETPAAPRRLDLVVLLAVTVVASFTLAGFEIRALDGLLGFPLDDSWIHLSFARSMAAGEGMSINPGELVTGSTAPLWTALLVPFFLLPATPVVWSKLLGIAFFAASVGLAWRLAADLGVGRWLAALAGLLTASSGWLLWASLAGMEITLFTALSLGAVILHRRERRDPSRPPLSLGVFALAALARPEGFLLMALALADRLVVLERDGDGHLRLRAPDRPDLRRLAVGLVLAAVVLVPVMAFYAHASGSPLPTTFDAKTSGREPGLVTKRYLAEVFDILFLAQPWAVFLWAGALPVLSERLGRARDSGALLLLWPLGLPLVYGSLAPGDPAVVGNFGRYYFPVLPFFVLLAVLALAGIARRFSWRGPVARAVAVLVAALLVAPSVGFSSRAGQMYLNSVQNVDDSDVTMVRYLKDRLPPEAKLALVDLGALSYFLPNEIVDLGGIASPDLVEAMEEAVERGESRVVRMVDYLWREQPDYLVVFPDWVPFVEAEGSPFQRLLVLEIPHNITMGGDYLVLYSTPWTRYPLRRFEGDPEPPPPPEPAGAGADGSEPPASLLEGGDPVTNNPILYRDSERERRRDRERPPRP